MTGQLHTQDKIKWKKPAKGDFDYSMRAAGKGQTAEGVAHPFVCERVGPQVSRIRR